MRIAATLLMTSCLLAATPVSAHDFSWDNLLLARIKLDKTFDYEAHVDSYMALYRPTVWKRYKNDEFELEEKRIETVQIMKSRVEEFPLDEPFLITTELTFGKYDFDKEVFPIEQLSESRYWYVSRYSTGDLPSRLKVFLSNPELIDTIPAKRDQARAFVSRRKDRYGNVNRRVQATMYVKILKLKSARDQFLVEIQSCKMFDDSGRTRLLYQIAKPEPNRQAESIQRSASR